jgi:hypothetical protein
MPDRKRPMPLPISLQIETKGAIGKITEKGSELGATPFS